MVEPFHRRTHSQGLWLVAALFVAEALALAVSTTSNPFPATGFSFAVALLVLTSGALPALLLPNIQSVLAACFAVVLASVLVLPFDPAWLPSPFLRIDASSLPRGLILRLVNAALLGPIALHFVACLGRHCIANRALGRCYGLTITLIVLVLLVSGGLLRNGGALLLVFWTLGLFAMALGLLFVIDRDPQLEQRRAAQQARLLLIGVLLAELPTLMRPITTRFGFDPAYDVLLVAQLILPLTIAYAILQHDLFGVDAALRRALAYATLSLVVLVVYFGLTLGLTSVLIRTMPQFGGIATMVGLFAAALAFAPAQRPVHHLIDQLFYPERLAFQNEVRTAQTRLAQVVARENIVQLLTHDLPQHLGAAWAWLGQTAEVPSPQPNERAGAWNTD